MQSDAKPKTIVILGPTGVGKSEAAVRVAERIGGEIVSADSRQVYRGMDIGTAKPGPALRNRVAHHLIDIVSPDAVFSAGKFRELAGETVRDILRRGKFPLIVGGTGLYLRALLTGLWEGPRADWRLRDRLEAEEMERGPGYLHEKLKSLDPEAAARIHPRDRSKTMRALEVFLLTGVALTRHHRAVPAGLPQLPALWIGLSRDRKDLYERINLRVGEMMRAGMLAEVRRLVKAGYSPALPSMRGLGYRQLVGYLKGRYTLERAVELIRRDTRRYAKRQLTWFRAEPRIRWVDLAREDGEGETAEKILQAIQDDPVEGD